MQYVIDNFVRKNTRSEKYYGFMPWILNLSPLIFQCTHIMMRIHVWIYMFKSIKNIYNLLYVRTPFFFIKIKNKIEVTYLEDPRGHACRYRSPWWCQYWKASSPPSLSDKTPRALDPSDEIETLETPNHHLLLIKLLLILLG